MARLLGARLVAYFTHLLDHLPVDARWCLGYLDTLQAFVAEHGRFSGPAQRADLDTVLDEARAYYQGVLRSTGA